MSWRSASSSRSRNRYFTPEHRPAGRCLCGLALSPGRMIKTMITTTSSRLSTTWATHGGQHAPSAERDVNERQNREDPGQSQPQGPYVIKREKDRMGDWGRAAEPDRHPRGQVPTEEASSTTGAMSTLPMRSRTAVHSNALSL